MQTGEPVSHYELPPTIVAAFNQSNNRVTSPSPSHTPLGTRPTLNQWRIYPSLPDGPRTVLDIRSLILTIHRLYSLQVSRHRPGVLSLQPVVHHNLIPGCSECFLRVTWKRRVGKVRMLA